MKGLPRLRPVLVKATSRRPEYKGWFHCWSTYADEDGSTPVGIIEKYDGSVTCEDPSDIVFADQKSYYVNSQVK